MSSEDSLLTKYHAKEMLVLPVETTCLLPYIDQSRFTTHTSKEKRTFATYRPKGGHFIFLKNAITNKS
jgi:hypothetical protein